MTTNKILVKPKKLHINLVNKDNLFYGLASLAIFVIILMLISNPVKYSASTMQGINLFIIAVLPGLFPFMFFTKLLTSLGMVKKISSKLSPVTKFLFNTSGISGYVFTMSILSGYPIGAKIIADLYTSGAITDSDAKKMSAFCTTSGPIFVIGSVGAVMFGNIAIGVIIYISHILASIMCGIILSGSRKKSDNLLNNDVSTASTKSNVDNILGSTISSTVESILLVGAYISIFFLLADILTDIGLLKHISLTLEKILSCFGINGLGSGVASGILEVTRGCKMLSQNANIWAISLCSFIISFSGLCIIMQSINFLSKCKIKTSRFLLTKLLHACISFIICLLLCLIFKI